MAPICFNRRHLVEVKGHNILKYHFSIAGNKLPDYLFFFTVFVVVFVAVLTSKGALNFFGN
jgi:hypothetical protein